MERETQRQFGDTQSEVLKDGSMNVGAACPAFFCSHDGDLKGLCHGDDFLCSGTTEAVANLWESPRGTV